MPICSAVVPGRDSYRDKPIATIGMLRFVEASFKKVRCDESGKSTNLEVNLKHKARTSTRAGKNPLHNGGQIAYKSRSKQTLLALRL